MKKSFFAATSMALAIAGAGVVHAESQGMAI